MLPMARPSVSTACFAKTLGRLAVLAAVQAVACRGSSAPPMKGIRATAMARSRGIESYDVILCDRDDVNAIVHGLDVARLTVHAVRGEAKQVLESAGTALVLRTGPNRIEVQGESSSIVLERLSGAWLARDSMDAKTTALLATLLAIDVDMAVQGTSLVGNAQAYVPCTLRCESASACVIRGNLPSCAESIVTCGECLEQEP